MGDMMQGKGTLTPDDMLMAYPEISDVVHEFVVRLQFDTTFEVIEFLAGQQIKSSRNAWPTNMEKCK